MAIKTLRVFQEFTSEGYVPMPVAGNIDYGVTIAGTFPGTTPTTFQTDDPDIDVTLTATTDYYVWIRSHGTDWNPMYTRNVRVYPDSPLVNNVVMGIIIANLSNTVPYVGATEDVDLGEFGLTAGYLGLDLTPTLTPTVAGTMSWNDADGTANLILKGGNVTLQIGQEQVTRIVNKTGANLLEANYQAVRVSGAQGNRLKVDLAQANIDANSAETLGLVTETINNNAEGFITTSGLVRNIDTTGTLQGETWADGDMLYLSGTTAGRITNIKPQAPTHTVIMGYVVRAHQTQGQIYVKVDNGYELDELHNVKITSVVNKNTLVYDSATSVWKNRNIFGTQGYVPYYDDTLLMNNSIIFTDGSQIIIGDVEEFSVGNKLSVVGNIAVDKNYGYHSGLYQILFRQDATGEFRIGTNAANDYTTFYANGTERVRISPSGFLGVGLTNPTSILHVKGTTAYTNAIIDNNSASGGGYYSAYQNGAEKAIFGVSGAWLLDNSSDASIIAKGVGQGIQFYTNGSTSEKMGINSDGNVFVGQTPTYVAGATQLVVRGKTGAGFVGVNHYDMSIKGFMNTFNSVFQVGTSTFHSLAFLVENIERGRVNSSGRLLWGTTTDNTTDLVQINGSLIATSLKKSGGLSTQFLKADGSVDSTTYGTGSVTSVALSAPTGFSVSGSPVTSSGTLALGFALGYSLPSDATQATWTAKQNALNGTGFVKIVGTTISYDNSTYYLASNPSGYISGITSLMVTNALGYTPYNATNPSGYISGNQTITLSGDVSGSGATAITTTLATITQGATGSFVKITLDTKGRVTGNVAVGSSDITSALGYTPYNSTNPAGYTTNVGTVTSVAMSVPTGLSISGSPITTSGTLALSLSAGYSIPTTASQGTWDTAYNRSLVSIGVSGTTTKTLTLTKQDGTTLTASWSDINTDAVTSVFGRTGAIIATSGDYTTAQVTESGNLYYLDSRARASISGGTGISYNSTTGVITNTITQYTDALARASISGGTGISYNSTSGVITNTITQYTDALARASLSFVAGSGAYNSTTGVITIPTNTSQLTNGAGYITGITSLMVTNALGYTPYNATNPSGYISGITSGMVTTALGYTPVTNARQLTINGTTYDLSADRTWTISGTISGLTSGYIPKATSASTLGNSIAYIQNNQFVIQGTTYGAMNVRSASGNANYLFFTENGVADRYLLGSPTGSGDLVFRSNSYDFSTGSEKMRLSSAGNLGIGTTNPLYPLHTVTTTTSIAAFRNSGAATGQILVGNTAGDLALRILASGDALIFADTSKYLAFGSNGGTERMRITSAGNLLVGTTTDSGDRVNISGTFRSTALWTLSGGITHWGNGTTAYGGLTWDTGYATIYATGGNVLNFGANGASAKMTLNTSGNLGLGVTPSAWSGYTALQNTGGSLIGASGELQLWQNAFYNGTSSIYVATATATRYAMVSGQHRWFNAASGTAGTAITWTQAMTLDASGNLALGQTTALTGGGAAKWITLFGSSYSGGIIYSINGTASAYNYIDTDSNFAIQGQTGIGFKVLTNGAEKMRITTGGNLLVGTTTDSGYKLDVNGTIRSTSSIRGQVLTLRNDALEEYATASDTVGVVVNYFGYGGSTLYYRNFTVYNGKGSQLFGITGSTGAATFSSSVTANGDVIVNNSNIKTYSNSYGSNGLLRMYGTDGLEKYQQGLTTGGDAYLYTFSGNNLLFYTNNGSERMRITSAGNLGINTTSPLSQLDVRGSGGATGVTLTLSNGGGISLLNDPLGIINFYSNDPSISSSGIFGKISVNNEFNGNWDGTVGRVATYMAFSTTSGATLSERMRITSSGNVLIGTTTNGGFKLDVNGTGRFTQNIIVNGTSSAYGLKVLGSSTTGSSYGLVVLAGTNSSDYAVRIRNYADNTDFFTIIGTGAATFSSSVSATSFIKTGGTSSQYLMADGSVTTSSGSVGGSGTTNYIPKWNGTTSLANSQIFDNGTQVTVGSNVAMYKFAVNPVSNSYFGIGFTGTNSIFVNAVDSGFTSVPIVNNAISHEWLIGFGSAMLLTSSLNLLIGTTTGVSGGGKLQVNGDVNINGNFKINGTVIGGGGGSGITGSGTTNMIAKWTGGTSLGDSALYDNGAYSMGIGTTSIAFPTDRKGLVIRPNGANSGEILLQNSGNTNGSTDGFAIANINGDGVALYNRINAHIRFGTNNTERLRITEDGNLGFGTTSQFGGGVKVIGIANSTTIPNTTPSGGGILFVQNGALKYMGSNGTYTTIANA